MTEQEWLKSTDSQRMLQFLGGKRSDGKGRPYKKYLFFLAVAHWPESLLLKGEQKKLSGLLRHIFGNPFRPYPAPAQWPSTVVQLADALYNGQDCSFALHDALLEAGHADLADHFRQEEWHPKGCWVVDLVLGKK